MSTTTETLEATPESPNAELSHRAIMTVLSGLILGMFLAALDQTVVSTALKTIGNDFGDLSAQAWVTTAFLITSTITAPLYGKLSDIFGRKRLYMMAIVIFVLGSALCGLSQSMYELAAFRAFQGIGAGGIMPLALAIVGDMIPPRERARYQGYMMATFASASVLGPVLGGLFAGTHTILGIAGWRWIFYLNVPIAGVTLFVVARVLKIDFVRRQRRIDWQGALSLAAGLVPLLVISEQGQHWGWFSIGAILCYLIGILGIGRFIMVQGAMGEDALLPLRLFRNSTFTLASAQMVFVGLGMFGAVSILPLYLQIVRDASPTKSGLLLLPLVAGTIGASLSAGAFVARTGRYRKLPVAGAIFMTVGAGLMTQIHADSSLVITDLSMAVFGIGVGLCMQSLALAMQNAVPPQDMGVASAGAMFFRNVGGAGGTAVFLTILFSTAKTHIAHAYAKAQTDPSFLAAARAHPNQIATLHRDLGGGLNNTSFVEGLAKPIAHPFFVGFTEGADVVFLVAAIVLVLQVILSLRMREIPLRRLSGAQARVEAEARAGVTPMMVEPAMVEDLSSSSAPRSGSAAAP